jgi:hypothetical protein
MNRDQIIDWLLKGDISIQYQVYRDLLKTERIDLQDRIAKEGWGAKFLSLQNSMGHWGMSFYQPKWTSTHYTLLDLKNLAISRQNNEIRATIKKLIQTQKASDGGIDPRKSFLQSDVCINGMFLNYASYFGMKVEGLKSIIDFILSQQLKDGGFNCHSNTKGAVHSSLHTTLSILEGIFEYSNNNYTYRLSELKKAENESVEFMLEHKLYQSHRTGKTIDQKMLMLSYPGRWRYDILKALDYFHFAGIKYDQRMKDAINVLLKKRRTDGRWPLQAKHAGQVHFDMENAGEASRWNTLRAFRVLKHFGFTG